jgi:hypothetical protein
MLSEVDGLPDVEGMTNESRNEDNKDGISRATRRVDEWKHSQSKEKIVSKTTYH